MRKLVQCKKNYSTYLLSIILMLCQSSIALSNALSTLKSLSDSYSFKPDTTFSIKGDVLYLRPSEFMPENSDTLGFPLFNIPVEYQPGFQLQANYQNNSYYEYFIQWLRYRNNQSNMTLRLDDLKSEGIHDVPYQYFSDFDFVNIAVGTSLYFKDDFSIFMYGGLEYAKFNTGYGFNYVASTTQSTASQESSYSRNNIGPLLGLILDYQFAQKFSIKIGASFAILYEMQKYFIDDHQVERNGGVVTSRSDINYTTKNDSSLIGTILDIGLGYRSKMKGDFLTVTAGFKSIIYLTPTTNWGGGFVSAAWIGKT